jgi:hypothetical protein
MFDRLYIANHGLICPTEKIRLVEKPYSGIGLMTFYMHILNFLLRENSRRDQAPYINYGGRLTKEWQHL